MTTTNRNDFTSFISGSTMEGAAYARHLAQQSMQDFDFMLIEGTITSPDCLIKLKEAEGFVQVKYNDEYIQQLSKTPFSTKQNQNGVLCINGFKMKEKYCGTHSIPFFPTSTFTSTGQTTVNSASTEVKFKCNSPTMSLGEQFENTLFSIRRMKVQENIKSLQEKYILTCNTFQNTISQFVLPLLGAISVVEGFNLQTFQDLISLTFPIYNIQMPQVNKVRLNALLEFYEKYKRLGNASFLQDYIEYGQLCINNEADFVPALQLKFWPDNIELFLDRIKFHRPTLYKMIYETSSMHLIPKWSTKTLEIDQELEFRYSFSAIECLLAKNRTRVEHILNGVARSIYYRYLKKQTSIEDNTKTLIPSYFVKTTVLWMCEIIDLNDQFTDTDNDQTIARIMAEKWIEYVIKLLFNGVCKHYFIDGLNLLESCSIESLAKVIDILQHQVNLDEDIKIQILIEQDNLINKRRQTTEDWLGNLKKKDILDAINDYKSLRENWLCPTTDVQDEGDAIGCLYTLNQLRTLDGYDQQNWITFKRLFLNTDETDWLPPLWDEQVGNCSVCEFTDNLSALGSMLSNIQVIMEKKDFNGTITTDFNQHEFTGGQNILNNLITPSNMVQNGIMTSWLPMFLCSNFNALPTGISSDVLSSIQHRSIIADHPIGPLNNLLQGRSLPSSMDSSTRQTFNQYSQHVSNNFLNLLNKAPNDDMTLNDLIKYYDKSQLITETETISFIPKQIISYATNSSSINKEYITLIIFDPNLNIKNIDENMYRSINDYVLFYSTKSQLLTYVQSINEEKIFIIIFDFSSDENFLSQLQNFNQIDSIYIYCVEQDNNYQVLMNKYSKIIGIYKEQTLLFEQVRINIVEQQSTLTFSFFDPKQIFSTYNKLSKENALFLWNLLLKDSLIEDDSIDKNLMIQKCREYYCQNSIELENIEQFEKTYESMNAYEWYLKNCCISKQLNKAFHKIDIEQLKLFNFFIRNLSSNIKSPSSIDKVYCTTIISINQFEMLLKNVSKLIIFNGFLVMNCSHNETVPYRSDAHVTVVFEVVNACTSNVCSIDSNRVIFDLGTTFQLDSFDFNDNLQLWIARLIVTNNSTQIAQNYIMTKQETMERMTLPIIMGDLLLICSDLLQTKKYFENLKNEDHALIYYYYGHIYYLKGEYDLALENFQISYELMISDERLKDSAFVLHDIGYVYDMKKEFKEAHDNHQKALEIRQIYYPQNDAYIGISFYNIGRTLVNIGDDDQALIYHKKALNIWEQTLTNDHSYIVRSLHSHGVIYFNKRDYTQALHYYTRALELYETTIPRDDHGILMIKNALENIKDLSSR